MYSPESHVRELSAELQENMVTVGRIGRTVCVLKMLAQHLNAFFNGTPPPNPEQRLNDHGNQIAIPDIQRVSDAPPTMMANNPTSTRILQTGTRTHQCTTWRNTHGVLPQIVRPVTAPPHTPFHVPHIIEEVSMSAKVQQVIQRRAPKHNKGSQINTQVGIYSPHQRQTPHPIARQPHHQPDGDEYVPPRQPQHQHNAIYSYKITTATRPAYEP